MTAPTGPFVSDWRTLRALTRCLPSGLGPAAREMYHLICGHTSKAGVCDVSIETLAAEMDRDMTTVRRARAQLERRELIVTYVGGGTNTNWYRVVARDIPKKLSTPHAPVRGVTPRIDAPHPTHPCVSPHAPVRGEGVIEEETDKERAACDCGKACRPGGWRCTDCQGQAALAHAKLAAMLGPDRVEQ